jgi:N6-adenosine-specific RNA methylase IME4
VIEFPQGTFEIIYADPPWHYRGRKQFGFAGDVGVDSGGAVAHYETMPLDELCKLPVSDIAADDALLYLWVTGPMVVDSLELMNEWGFNFATVAFVWNKQLTNPGYYTLSQAEFVFVGKKNRIPQPRGSRNERQWLTEVIDEQRSKHSRKPSVIRDRIAAMHRTQSKIELFAREQVPDWTVWGNEVTT